MIIECSFCESKVDGIVIGEHISYSSEEPPFKVSLLKCPVCDSAIIGGQDGFGYAPDYAWDGATRLWPNLEKHLDWRLPKIVRASIEEAQKCYKAKAYIACAVMCGRALEGICSEHKTSSKTLAGGLKELLRKKIIDEKIYEWGEALREHRNIGAHATLEKISKEEAKDLLEFTNAICDYVFLLTRKFEDFKARKSKQEKNKK